MIRKGKPCILQTVLHFFLPSLSYLVVAPLMTSLFHLHTAVWVPKLSWTECQLNVVVKPPFLSYFLCPSLFCLKKLIHILSITCVKFFFLTSMIVLLLNRLNLSLFIFLICFYTWIYRFRFSGLLFLLVGENQVYRVKSWQMKQGQATVSVCKVKTLSVSWPLDHGYKATYSLFHVLVVAACFICKSRLLIGCE